MPEQDLLVYPVSLSMNLFRGYAILLDFGQKKMYVGTLTVPAGGQTLSSVAPTAVAAGRQEGADALRVPLRPRTPLQQRRRLRRTPSPCGTDGPSSSR